MWCLGCTLVTWIANQHEKHLHLITGIISVILALWLSATLAAGQVTYYLDSGEIVLQDNIIPWFWNGYAVAMGLFTVLLIIEVVIGEVRHRPTPQD